MIRVNEMIRREVGEAVFRLVNESGFDVAAVTVTHVVTSPNLRQARVLVSIRDHEQDRGRMMALLARHRVEMQARINTNLGLKYTPRLSFELDPSIAQGDRVLALLSKMEGMDPEPPPEMDLPPESEDEPEPQAEDENEADDETR